MTKRKIPSTAFKEIYNQILQKFKQDIESKGGKIEKTVKQFYGYYDCDKTKPNLQAHIEEDEEFQKFCRENAISPPKNIGKHLYEKWLKVVKHNQSEVIFGGKIYGQALSAYLRIDIEKIVNKHEKNKINSISSNNTQQNWLEYIGYFCYSNHVDGKWRMDIVNFDLKIDVSKTKNVEQDTNYSTKMTVYYPIEGIELYKGTSNYNRETGLKITVGLTPEPHRELHFVFITTKHHFLKKKFLQGAYTRASIQKDGIIGSETFIIKKEQHNNQAAQTIEYYLRNKQPLYTVCTPLCKSKWQ